MKKFFSKIISWFKTFFKAGKIKAELDKAIEELSILRQAVVDFSDAEDEYKQQIAKYKKQVKELKAKLKQTKEE